MKEPAIRQPEIQRGKMFIIAETPVLETVNDMGFPGLHVLEVKVSGMDMRLANRRRQIKGISNSRIL